MKIFVTGGTGFVGTHAVHALEARGHAVKLLSCQLSELDTIEDDLGEWRPDAVLHLAWEGLPDYSEKLSRKNYEESAAFFRLLARLGIQKTVATGTCWQYAAREGGQKENAPRKDADSFTTAKNGLLSLGTELFREHAGSFVWAIPFFLYGPGQRASSLVPSLIAEAAQGKTPHPKNPDATNDMVYIGDAAEALALLIERNVESGIYNVGSGALTGTLDVARAVAKLLRVPPPPQATIRVPHGFFADIAKTRAATGWVPRVSIEDGVAKTVAWFRDHSL